MSTVQIGSHPYETYADVSEADLYLDAASHAAAWRADDVDADTKARLLVTATRILDRQTWRDEYNTFELRAAQPNIVNASIELALALLDGSEVQNTQTGVERIRSITAGPVSITNFRGIDEPSRFPQIVQELLRGYLNAGGTLGPVVSGVDDLTTFPIQGSFTRGL